MNRKQFLQTRGIIFLNILLLPLCLSGQNLINEGKMYIDTRKCETSMCINGNVIHFGQKVAVVQHGNVLIKGNFISAVAHGNIFVSGNGYSVFSGDSTQHIYSMGSSKANHIAFTNIRVNNSNGVVVSDTTRFSVNTLDLQQGELTYRQSQRVFHYQNINK